MSRASKRGGARNTGRKLRNNTSGLAAFGFKNNGSTVYATAAIGEARRERSITAHGAREALRQLIKIREEAGYPVPTIGQAVRAFGRWRKEHGVSL